MVRGRRIFWERKPIKRSRGSVLFKHRTLTVSRISIEHHEEAREGGVNGKDIFVVLFMRSGGTVTPEPQKFVHLENGITHLKVIHIDFP